MSQKDIRTTISDLYGGNETKVPPALMELVVEHPEYAKSLPSRPPWRWRELSKDSLGNVLDLYAKVIGPDGLLRVAMSDKGKTKKNPPQKEAWEYFLSGLGKAWRKTSRVVGKAAKLATRVGTAQLITRSPAAARAYEVYHQIKGGKSLAPLDLPGTAAYAKVQRKEAREAQEKASKAGARATTAKGRQFKSAEETLKKDLKSAQEAVSHLQYKLREQRHARKGASPVVAARASRVIPDIEQDLSKEMDRLAEATTKLDKLYNDWELLSRVPGAPLGRIKINPIDDGEEIKNTIQRFHATGPIRRARKDEHFPVISTGDWVGILGKLLFVCYRSSRDHSVNPYIHGFNNVFEKGQNNNEILQAMDTVMSEPGMASRFMSQKYSPRLVIHTDLELFSIEAPLGKVAPKEAAYFDKHAAALASGATDKNPQIKTISAPEEDDVVGIVGDCLFFGWLDPNGQLRWFGFDRVFVDGPAPHPILESTMKSIIANAQTGSRRDEWMRGPTLMATSDQSYLLFLARMSDRGIINEDTQWLRK